MKPSMQIFVLATVTLLACTASAQQVVNTPETLTSLRESWEWAQDQIADEESIWIAYGFTVQIDERFTVAFSSYNEDYIEWNRASNNGWRGNWYNNSRGGWHNRQSLAALQTGVSTSQQDFPISKDLLALFRYEDGIPEEIRIITTGALVNWKSSTVYWLGNFVQEESFRHLLGLLPQFEKPHHQRTLVRSIGLHESPDRDLSLASLLSNSEDMMLRYAALESLAIRKSPTAEATLAQTAQDENAALTARRIAISALSRYDSSSSLRLLIELAGDRNPQMIRREAVESLALIETDTSTETLQEIVAKDDNRAVVMEAIRGLSRDIQHFDTLARVAETHRDSDIREHTMEIVAAMDGERAFPLLQRLFMEDPSLDLREEALEAMDRVPGELAVPFLLAVANDETEYDSDQRSEAVDTLAEFEPDLVMDDLNRLAWGDSNEDVRENAVQALAELNNASVNSLLLEIAKNHPSPHTRREAMDELEDLVL